MQVCRASSERQQLTQIWSLEEHIKIPTPMVRISKQEGPNVQFSDLSQHLRGVSGLQVLTAGEHDKHVLELAVFHAFAHLAGHQLNELRKF